MTTPRIPYLTEIDEELVVVWVHGLTGKIEGKTVLMQAPPWWRSGERALTVDEAFVEFRLILEAASDGGNPQSRIDALAELEQLRRCVTDLEPQS